MFKLIRTSPEGSDCTAPYDVELGGKYTVKEFIEDVLKDAREWGHIGIDPGPGVSSVFGDPHCEYSHGVLKSNLPEDILEMSISSARASGGWSRMDYILSIDLPISRFIEITDHYGIRYEYGLYGVYRYDQDYLYDRTSAFRNKFAAVNECKYLERLTGKDIEEAKQNGSEYHAQCEYTCRDIDEPLILEPDDWDTAEWEVIKKLFGMVIAERIVISDYTLETYGIQKKVGDED